MFLSLEKLLALGLVTVTNDKLVVCCKTIYVIECTYKEKPLHIVNHAITIALPTALKSLAPEQLHDQDIGLHIKVDPIRSRNEQIKAMAELSYAPAPLQATIPAPVLEGDNLTATICVATSHSSYLPNGTWVVEQRGTCTISRVTMNLTSITYVDGTRYSLKLAVDSVLLFTFHKDIAKEAVQLLNQAHDEASIKEGRQLIQKRLAECELAAKNDAQRCRDASVTQSSSTPFLSCILPTPMFDDGKGSTSTGIWADDADVASTHASVPFPREEEANALTGAFDNVLSRDEQKTMAKAQKEKEAQRQAELAKCAEEEEEAQRLKEAEEAQRLEQETQRQSKLAEQQHTTNIHDAPDITVPSIWIKTYNTEVVKTLLSMDRQCRLELQGDEQKHARGTAYRINVSPLLVAGIVTLRVSVRGNEIIVGELTDDGTLRWGTCANVWNGSYGAVVSMFPEMSVTVQRVIETRATLKIQKPHQQQGLLPFPEPMRVIPVFDMWGNVVAYQQAPPFAHQQVPPFA